MFDLLMELIKCKIYIVMYYLYECVNGHRQILMNLNEFYNLYPARENLKVKPRVHFPAINGNYSVWQ